jgi:Fe2+ or Zn2+ uptake regulation protein
VRDTEMALALRAHGYKLTPQRLAVLEVIQNGFEHLTPAEVLERASTIYPRLGLTTVYRTLEVLSELGFVRRVHLERGCHGYVAASCGHRHALICQRCNRVVEFPGEENLGPFMELIEARTGYRIENHLLQLSGLCPECLAGAG